MNRIIRIFLSLLIAISPVIIMNNANAAIGGWTLSNPVAVGASAVYDATKTVLINGKNVVKNSAVTIAPTAADVAKVLARGGAAYALSVAVEQLLGAVDWVMKDGSIVYTQKEPVVVNEGFVYDKVFYSSSSSYCSAHQSSIQSKAVYPKYANPNCSQTTKNGKPYAISSIEGQDKYGITQMVYVAESYYVVVTEEDTEEKSIPLETVAAQVISNAESSTDENVKVGAQTATMAAAADIVNEAESDETKARPIATELDKAASTATDESSTGTATQTKTDPTTGEPVSETTDIALEFPTFCGWAPIVCEAAQVVISVPQAVAEAWATTKEWLFADDPLPDAESVDISQLPTPELQENAISWGAQCPQDVQVPINMQGVSSTITFSWSPWCQLLSIIKPAIIASAYIGAAFIVLGLRT